VKITKGVILLVMVFALMGCGVANTISLQMKAQRGEDVANAARIASAINLYNHSSEKPEDKITSISTFEELNIKLGILSVVVEETLIDGVSAHDRALKRIYFFDDVAIVDGDLSREP